MSKPENEGKLLNNGVFEWDVENQAEKDNLSYVFYIANNDNNRESLREGQHDFIPEIKDNTSLTLQEVQKSITTIKITDGNTYKWQVLAIDEENLAEYSKIYSFTKQSNTPPEKFNISYPKQNGVINNIQELKWSIAEDPEGGEVTYDIYIQQNDNLPVDYAENDTYKVFSNLNINDSGTGNYIIDVIDNPIRDTIQLFNFNNSSKIFKLGNEYSIRIVAKDLNGLTTTSDNEITFKNISYPIGGTPLDEILLIKPASESTTSHNLNIVFNLLGGYSPSVYHYYISVEENRTNLDNLISLQNLASHPNIDLSDDETKTPIERTVSYRNLTKDKTYYIRVAVKTTDGQYTQMSDIHKITTKANNKPAVPVPIFPSANSVNNKLNKFIWKISTDLDNDDLKYTLELSQMDLHTKDFL